MTLRHRLILVAALSAAYPALADDINDQILSTVNPTTVEAATAAAPADAPRSPIEETDLWQRIRNGFGITPLDSDYVRRHENWYLSRPDYWQRMLNRSSKYLHFVVEEVEKRGYPTEIALLPMIESAYNPRAYSHAHASGMWQFIPSTGTHYGLEQTWWYDGRRDIFAATHAALDYLGVLYRMFGDWKLALAAYNWGEGAVSRAIARNQARGLPTDYESLKMPAETRNYVPKLVAVRNLLAEPERYGLTLPTLENKPYLTVVTTTRHMDLEVAARLADMSVEEFLDLNPAYKQPVIAYKAKRKLLVPLDKAPLFTDRLAATQEPLLSWQAVQVSRGDTLERLVERYGSSGEELQRINRLTGKRLAPGQLLLVPRQPTLMAAAAVPAATTLTPVAEVAPAAQAAPAIAVNTAAAASTAALTPSPVEADSARQLVALSLEETAATTASPASPNAAPAASTAEVAAVEEPRTAPERPTSHVVARGDTAYGLAARYGLSVQELLEINNLKSGRLVQGKRLTLVARADEPVRQRATSSSRHSKRYKVRAGDTAYSIARRFSVEPAELLRWNGLKPTSVLRPGDNMTIFIARS